MGSLPKKLRITGIYLSLSVIISACTAGAAPVPPVKDKAKVLLQEITLTEDLHRLLVPVKVEASVRSMVTAEVEGLVTKIQKPLGSKVKRGEVVLYLENRDPSFTYAAVPVRAPVAGVISQMGYSLMSRVSRGDKLFSVINPSSVKLLAEIPGSDLAGVEPGTPAIFKDDLADKDGLPIKVTGVSPLVDPRSGTAPAELEFVKGTKSLPAIGMVGHALFEMKRGKVLLIPDNALSYRDGKPTVKVMDAKGLVKWKTVELGEQRENLLVIKSGLEAGEKLIVRASRSVKEGDAVEVETSAPAVN